ncbi:MSHA pilin protein MshC [Halospina denitrificans]|uniref:MSHA pilin protein MshC n=1 Tax=Halospina denitrificans TaxID=332522 RepID=A0A4V3EPP9_9GAMM|nr:type II secretion system protein [Halospina denitrificans]TDT36988.1 MSHA pilin protein MshC [Halospina denitrificans]
MKYSATPQDDNSGFTLVELVITLVLIGILSALGIGLLASPGAYSAGAARDQFVSSALLAQKRALANSGSTDTVTLEIEENADEWIFRVTQGNTQYPKRSAAREGATLSVNGSPPGNPETFEFDPRGRLVGGGDAELVFDGTSAHRACISSLGFAYPERCQ